MGEREGERGLAVFVRDKEKAKKKSKTQRKKKTVVNASPVSALPSPLQLRDTKSGLMIIIFFFLKKKAKIKNGLGTSPE